MLLSENKNQEYHLGIWKIEESREELLSSLFGCEKLTSDINIVNINSESRILERLAVRVLLRQMLKADTEIRYYDSGRPFLKGSLLNISISHTKGYVAIILSKNKYTGIDIQNFTEKIKRIKSRFISKNEYIDQENELIHLLLHWSAKESLYKGLGVGVDLKDSFNIKPFEPLQQGIIQAQEYVTQRNLNFNIKYVVEKDFVMTYLL